MLLIQVVLMLAAEAGTDLHVHSPELVGMLVGLVVIDVAESAWIRFRGPSEPLALGHGAVDLVVLTGILSVSGGIQNPLQAAYLVYIALLALVLPARRAWAMAGVAMVLQAIAVLHPGHAPGHWPHDLPMSHMVGHIVAFDLAAAALTLVVNRLTGALREREARERESARRRATTERLAALGTLAAGVAHELGTPLATIQLLGEESEREPPSAERMADLLREVERCRLILERLRVAADDGSPGECAPQLSTWVAEWTRVAPDIAVEVRVADLPARVSGTEASWRGAVWVALDNARRAGARRIEVEARETDRGVEVRITDDGAGLSAEDAARCGEPFRSGWGGTGLGLFVSRTFAESVGGEVTLEPGEGRGAVATLRMPRRNS